MINFSVPEVVGDLKLEPRLLMDPADPHSLPKHAYLGLSQMIHRGPSLCSEMEISRESSRCHSEEDMPGLHVLSAQIKIPV